ncbi:RNA polymerase sigma factor [Pedobacter nototheniae]|uniref:RNA polymerase sigma factor n=1 Tax=Pedobacter nototheniae TaxID=2488994 RepID=UPI00103D11D0|nr:sigma factor [Pedobacter nototheniae]
MLNNCVLNRVDDLYKGKTITMVTTSTNYTEKENFKPWLSHQTSFFYELRSQDLKAFKTLYQQYAAALYGSISRTLSNQQHAEYVLEQTFIEAWNCISTFDESKTKIFTWLSKIAKTQCCKFL